MGNQQSAVLKRGSSRLMNHVGSKPALFTEANSHPILQLQQTVGNRAVQRLIESQFKRSAQEDFNEAPGPGTIVNAALNSPGNALDPATRTLMESSFGSDFAGVRIHTDALAAESATAIRAQAYTSGEDIVFAEGRYAPGTLEGQRLLAHELTHVVQQGPGPVAGTPTADGSLSISDPEDAFEKAADAQADQVVQSLGGGAVQSSGEATTAGAANSLATAGTTVQRDDDDQGETSIWDIAKGPLTSWAGLGLDEGLKALGAAEGAGPLVPGVGGLFGGMMGIKEGVEEGGPMGVLKGTGGALELAGGVGEAAVAGGAAEAGLAGTLAEAGPVGVALGSGLAIGTGMAGVADSSYTKTGFWGTDEDTGQNRSAMDWGSNWGTDWDKAHANDGPSVMGGILAGAGGIAGGFAGAGQGAWNWLTD
jgi:hypothetical protein